MQFHGRIDVGQLMSRASSDPGLVQHIIQQVLQEVAEAPFEIIVSVGVAQGRNEVTSQRRSFRVPTAKMAR